MSTRLAVAYGPATLPRMDQVSVDVVAIALAFIAGLAAVLLSSTLPAVGCTKADARTAFGARDRSTASPTRFQDLLVTAQIGGTVLLLVGAVLFAQSFLRAQGEALLALGMVLAAWLPARRAASVDPMTVLRDV